MGETKQTLTARVAGHRSDINTRSVRKCPHVVTHFNAPGHSLQDMRIFPIEQMRSSDSNSRKMREKFWMSKLRTVYPHGLNERSQVLYGLLYFDLLLFQLKYLQDMDTLFWMPLIGVILNLDNISC